MARRTDSRQIGEHKYHVIALPAMSAVGAAVRLGNAIGPAVEAFKDGGVVAMGRFLSQLKADDLEFFAGLFKEHTTVEIKGKRLPLASIFDEHFSGQLEDMLKWLAFCAEVNFKGFFPKIEHFVRKHVEDEPAVAAAQDSPSTG